MMMMLMTMILTMISMSRCSIAKGEEKSSAELKMVLGPEYLFTFLVGWLVATEVLHVVVARWDEGSRCGVAKLSIALCVVL